MESKVYAVECMFNDTDLGPCEMNEMFPVIQHIFSTKEKAVDYVRNLGYELDEHDQVVVYDTDTKYESYFITEYEFD